MTMRGLRSAWRGARAAGWRLVAEAVLELLRARALTQLSAHRYIKASGLLATTESTDRDAGLAAALRIGQVVAAAAKRMPFRALCLQQAVATRRMMHRRGLPATLYLAVSKQRADRQTPALGRAAHAWVCLGDAVVCGDGDLERYAVVARVA